MFSARPLSSDCAKCECVLIRPGIRIFPSRFIIFVSGEMFWVKLAVLPIAAMREPVTSNAPSMMISREVLTVIIVQWVNNVDIELDIAAVDAAVESSSLSFHFRRTQHYYYRSSKNTSGLNHRNKLKFPISKSGVGRNRNLVG